ncbi:MAG: phage scaffolding protein [Lentisphaeria bacterium]
MKTEELKALGLNDEQISAIMKQNGQDVENIKTKYADYEDVKKQLGEAGKTIEGLKASAGDADKIKKDADDWKAKAEQADKDAKEKIAALQFDYALNRELEKSKVRSTKAARAFLDMQTLKMDGEKITGLEDQLKALKESESYLFEDDKPTPKFSTGNSGRVEPTSDAAIRAVMGLPPETK